MIMIINAMILKSDLYEPDKSNISIFNGNNSEKSE